MKNHFFQTKGQTCQLNSHSIIAQTKINIVIVWNLSNYVVSAEEKSGIALLKDLKIAFSTGLS